MKDNKIEGKERKMAVADNMGLSEIEYK